MKRREKNLTDESIEEIVRILDGWAGPLSWKLLVEAVAQRLHFQYTRQTLNKHERVRQAFVGRKRRLRNGDPTTAAKPRGGVALQKASERISRLEEEIQRLRDESDRFLDQFARWAFNAYQRNVSIDQLNAALPPISRGQTITMPAPRPIRVPELKRARIVDENSRSAGPTARPMVRPRG